MGMVRNFIDIIGIISNNELNKLIEGQAIEASQTENIYLENNNIKDIYQIIIGVEVKSTRVIDLPLKKIVVFDGIKKIKTTYYDKNNNVGIMDLDIPYNSFIEIDNKESEIEKIDMYIADAYFKLVNTNTMYSYILYVFDVQYYNQNVYSSNRDNLNNLYVDVKQYNKLENKNKTIDYKCVDKYEKYKNNILEELVMSSENISYENKISSDERCCEFDELIDIDYEYP